MKKFKKIVFLLAISVVFFCCKKNLKELPVLVDKQSKTQTCGCEQAYPGQGELVTFGKGDNSVTLRKIGNKYILDGDIILAPNQVELLRKRYDNTGGHNTESTFTIDFVKLWPGGVVYYTIDNNLPNQTRVTNAISHWEANTPITFVQRTNQTNYVTFVEGSGGTCGSPLGMSGGQQYIELVAGCSTGQTIHEIGHTIGLYHEQSRSDRDNFINIHYDNMLPDQKVLYQFKTYNQRQENGFESGSFDFNSIMMYGSLDFSIDQNTPLPVMTRVSDGGIWYGQRIGLSQGDIDGVNYLYGSPQLYARLNFNTIQEINESYYTYYSYHISVSFFYRHQLHHSGNFNTSFKIQVG